MELSSPILVSSLHKALLELDCLYTASDCLIAYSVLDSVLEVNCKGSESGDKPSAFWLHTKAALMGSFAINWCKLFGTDSSDRYWKQVTLEQKAFRELVYGATGFNYQAWADYRKAMTNFRNQVTVHLTPYFDYNDVPDFSMALIVLKTTHQWLRQVLPFLGEPLKGNLENERYFEEAQKEMSMSIRAYK